MIRDDQVKDTPLPLSRGENEKGSTEEKREGTKRERMSRAQKEKN
jgi:hypothetical protein